MSHQEIPIIPGLYLIDDKEVPPGVFATYNAYGKALDGVLEEWLKPFVLREGIAGIANITVGDVKDKLKSNLLATWVSKNVDFDSVKRTPIFNVEIGGNGSVGITTIESAAQQGDSSTASKIGPSLYALEEQEKKLAIQVFLSKFTHSELDDLMQTALGRKDYFLNRIVCAANRVEGFPMLIGPRHWDNTMRFQYDLLENLYAAAGDTAKIPKHSLFEEGFIDKHGAFKTRTEAWAIAKAAGQIIRLCGGNDRDGGTLYSENLY